MSSLTANLFSDIFLAYRILFIWTVVIAVTLSHKPFLFLLCYCKYGSNVHFKCHLHFYDILKFLSLKFKSLQCFDAVGWAAERASGS